MKYDFKGKLVNHLGAKFELKFQLSGSETHNAPSISLHYSMTQVWDCHNLPLDLPVSSPHPQGQNLRGPRRWSTRRSPPRHPWRERPYWTLYEEEWGRINEYQMIELAFQLLWTNYVTRWKDDGEGNEGGGGGINKISLSIIRNHPPRGTGTN